MTDSHSNDITSSIRGEREEGVASASESDASATAGGSAGTFGGLSPAEAARRSWEKRRERLALAAEGARPVKGDVRSVIAEALDEIPRDELKAYVKRAVLEGRDVRAITSLMDRVSGEHKADALPGSVAELESSSVEELIAFVRECDRQLLASSSESMEGSG